MTRAKGSAKHLTVEQRTEMERRLVRGDSANQVEVELGIGRSTVAHAATKLRREGRLDPSQVGNQTKSEYADAAFWKKKSAEQGIEVRKLQHTLDQIAGPYERKVEPPKWTIPKQNAKQRSSMGLLQLSDLHVGEVVELAATAGYNEYTPEIFKRRLRRAIAAAVPITKRWAQDTKLAGFCLALNGDLISGDIHEELRNTNAITSHKQVDLAVDELMAAILILEAEFGQVYVPVTPGNHGRTTLKPPSKKVHELSYDTMVGTILAREFRDRPNVQVDVAQGFDITYDLLGHRVLQTHGDHTGTGGGKGFGGPDFPIVRGARLLQLSAFQQRDYFDILLTGHYHTTSNPSGGKNLANGSMVGYSEYSHSLRAIPEPPQQWLALIHERWGLRERIPLVLDEPGGSGAK